MERLLIDQDKKITIFQIIGAILLLLGIVALLIIGISSYFEGKEDNDGTFVAIGFFFIMMGIALLFPGMLRSDSKGGLSTMRIAVFMVVSVFVFLCIKIGWSCQSFSNFKLDSTWGYIIAAALGSKAVQSLGENNIFGKSTNNPNSSQQNTLFNNSSSPSEGAPFHDPSKINPNPPSYRPVNIK